MGKVIFFLLLANLIFKYILSIKSYKGKTFLDRNDEISGFLEVLFTKLVYLLEMGIIVILIIPTFIIAGGIGFCIRLWLWVRAKIRGE